MTKLDPIKAILKTGDLRSSTFTQIWITIRDLHKYLDSVLNKRAGISTIQMAVLHAITENGGAMNPTEIAQWISTQRHNITTLIRRMEKSELITMRRNENDQRQIKVSITEKGKLIFNNTIPIAKEAIDDVMSIYDEGEIIQIQSMCTLMAASISRAKSKIRK